MALNPILYLISTSVLWIMCQCVRLSKGKKKNFGLKIINLWQSRGSLKEVKGSGHHMSL